MQYARAQIILSGQTAQAQRVFAAVPKQEFWTVGQISNEMNRMFKHNTSKGEITGCLRCLVDAGLVAEEGVLTFRSRVKPPIQKEFSMLTAAKAPTKQVTLADQLLDLATAMRKIAEKADEIALEFDTQLKEAGKGDEKLKELQATLRSLMGDANG